jgi:hypothetical protein
LKRFLWTTLGTLSLILGAVGAILPVMPTTPFLLLAAACYYRGSDRMHDWLLTNRWFGRYIADYRSGLGVPLKTKVLSLAMLWVSIGLSAVLFADTWGLRIILAIVAVGVTVHLLMIKTRRRE